MSANYANDAYTYKDIGYNSRRQQTWTREPPAPPLQPRKESLQRCVQIRAPLERMSIDRKSVDKKDLASYRLARPSSVIVSDNQSATVGSKFTEYDNRYYVRSDRQNTIKDRYSYFDPINIVVYNTNSYNVPSTDRKNMVISNGHAIVKNDSSTSDHLNYLSKSRQMEKGNRYSSYDNENIYLSIKNVPGGINKNGEILSHSNRYNNSQMVPSTQRSILNTSSGTSMEHINKDRQAVVLRKNSDSNNYRHSTYDGRILGNDNKIVTVRENFTRINQNNDSGITMIDRRIIIDDNRNTLRQKIVSKDSQNNSYYPVNNGNTVRNVYRNSFSNNIFAFDDKAIDDYTKSLQNNKSGVKTVNGFVERKFLTQERQVSENNNHMTYMVDKSNIIKESRSPSGVVQSNNNGNFIRNSNRASMSLLDTTNFSKNRAENAYFSNGFRVASIEDKSKINKESLVNGFVRSNKSGILTLGKQIMSVEKEKEKQQEHVQQKRNSVIFNDKRNFIHDTNSVAKMSIDENKALTNDNRKPFNNVQSLVAFRRSSVDQNNVSVNRNYRYSSCDTGSLVEGSNNSIQRLSSGNRNSIIGSRNSYNRISSQPEVYGPLPYKSPRRYVESDVTIHYKSPVRQEPRPLVPEDELARRQADHMRRVYQEERRRKYLQELQDMNSRRHTDNFTPSQKSPISLNRYDSFGTRQVAKALFNFVGQSTRELTFRKGDLILVRRQIDNNWFEGEHNSKVGLFPTNYVELVEYDTTSAPSQRRPSEGRARAKFNFAAQTHLELALRRGELVTLTRRVDDNWYEGRLGDRKGIFPVTYVEVLAEPTASRSTELSTPIVNSKPVASPAAHSVVGAAGVASLGSHHYTPQLNSPALSNSPSSTAPLNLPNHGITSHHARPASATLPRASDHTPVNLNNHEPLYVDTNAEAVPYRAMYKYRPQNPDELELSEGDTVYVLEKCDDGWYVGSSQRTGRFGTFPGNYVERI